ncbi:MAG: response regulator transcription factor [Anaerolineaceae bacterium]|nr:response regulator transcription factor [Anaerolineaceae bacterium]
MIRLLIADDHIVMREGLSALIEEEENIEVVAQAANGEEAIELYNSVHPDIILMDLYMPVMDGLEAIRRIIANDSTAKILVLTSYSDETKIFSAIQAGALGYLLKATSADELLEAIHQVYQGNSYLPPAIARQVIHGIQKPAYPNEHYTPTLTRREYNILELLAKGLSNKEMAATLTISERTVSGHVANILTKLNLENRTQAALYAQKLGIKFEDVD